MSTLRVSNIEAKADASSPTIDEKIKVTSSQGRVLVQIDGKTAGITSIGINTTSTSFTIDGNQNVQFVGVITAANVNTTGVSTFTTLNVGTGGTVITTTATGFIGLGTNNPLNKTHIGVSNPTSLGTSSDGIRISDGTRNIQLSRTGSSYSYGGITGTGSLIYSYDTLSLQADTSNPIIFSTGANERARLDSSGNLQLSTAGTSLLNSSGRKILNQTGGVLQVVNTIKTNQFTTTSGSPVDVTGLSASITPSSTSSKVLVIAWVVISTSGGGGDGYARLVRDSTAIGNGDDGYFGQSAGQDYFGTHSKPITYLDSPATTSSTTYKIQVWGANTSYVNGRGLDASFRTSSGITLMEISG
jgi:hypothetical protein